MKTVAAVLYEMGKPPPYRVSQPLVVEEVELEGPGAGQVLVEITAAGLPFRLVRRGRFSAPAHADGPGA